MMSTLKIIPTTLSDKASDKDLVLLDNLINTRITEGWELVTYHYMATATQVRGAFIYSYLHLKAK
jgi:hypothetical protein